MLYCHFFTSRYLVTKLQNESLKGRIKVKACAAFRGNSSNKVSATTLKLLN